MIQHDMLLWDHGMPRADGSYNPEQRSEADVNIEFQTNAKLADEAMKLAFRFRDANEKYATDYPAAVGHHGLAGRTARIPASACFRLLDRAAGQP
jgi:hypothetical protein